MGKLKLIRIILFPECFTATQKARTATTGRSATRRPITLFRARQRRRRRRRRRRVRTNRRRRQPGTTTTGATNGMTPRSRP